ncbi:Fe-S cluster assembly scaffold SufA [Serratia sp. OLHL2]|jgi:Fe-S cluster assembly protein SufA|uniref:Fe-S cluster assembly scaffold SufA n=13 Tax=Bacteria TaxID=2 RepID=A0A9X9C162_9GAMM|nr:MULTISPECIES: Fe-S cluster assembly scaffold SufA [Serratia]KAB5492606.1 Fe-S cluster assembly scaffold SufA [Enterobacter sp. RJAL6]KLE37452.1 iron-sulfur cluster assembly scaffold protein [Serratia sp. TEL]MDI6930783.1 Fe-S cluster assembly scaffold SufA [Serratia sp. Se-PFBMAAmG]QHI78022.1 Fe-S cluster assembly scaffold SufA [Serratia sp. NGAS9]WIF08690.1 Fe-S cluster assembly scaffold SufA [Serratia sp. B1]SBM08827.1 iron binding protein SufA for iron-sulfur cluster assembly [Klebsiell
MQTENVGTFSLDENVWQGISLSDSAVRQITKLMQQDPQVKGLQLGVKQSGCAGFAYVLDLTREPADDDLLFERDGAKLYVPLKAMPFIDGTTVDYVREGLNQIFKFNNPKAQHACGCGESFGV